MSSLYSIIHTVYCKIDIEILEKCRGKREIPPEHKNIFMDFSNFLTFANSLSVSSVSSILLAVWIYEMSAILFAAVVFRLETSEGRPRIDDNSVCNT